MLLTILGTIPCMMLDSTALHSTTTMATKAKVCSRISSMVMGYATAIILIGIPVLLALHLWVFVEFILILTRSGGYGTDNNGVPLD